MCKHSDVVRQEPLGEPRRGRPERWPAPARRGALWPRVKRSPDRQMRRGQTRISGPAVGRSPYAERTEAAHIRSACQPLQPRRRPGLHSETHTVEASPDDASRWTGSSKRASRSRESPPRGPSDAIGPRAHLHRGWPSEPCASTVGTGWPVETSRPGRSTRRQQGNGRHQRTSLHAGGALKDRRQGEHS